MQKQHKKKAQPHHSLRRVKLSTLEKLAPREGVMNSFGSLGFTVPAKQAAKAEKHRYNTISKETYKKRRVFQGY